MRTTLRIDDDFLREVKKRATRKGLPPSELLDLALRQSLRAEARPRRGRARGPGEPAQASRIPLRIVDTSVLIPVDAAWDLVDDWLAHPGVRVVQETEEYPRLWSELPRGTGNGGDSSTAAWIAAIALPHGASVLAPDSRFARFPGVRWESPLGS